MRAAHADWRRHGADVEKKRSIDFGAVSELQENLFACALRTLRLLLHAITSRCGGQLRSITLIGRPTFDMSSGRLAQPLDVRSMELFGATFTEAWRLFDDELEIGV